MNFNMLHRYWLWALAVSLASPSANAQIQQDPDNQFVRYGDTHVVRFRVGLTVEAASGPVENIVGMVAVPFPSPEQEVLVVDQDISPEIENLEYRFLEGGGARQMVISVPYLANGAEARAILTCEVRTRVILPPEDTSELVIPTKPDRELKRYLGRSEMIQTNHAKIRKTLRDIFAEKTDDSHTSTDSVDDAEDDLEIETGPLTDWQRVEKIYDYVWDAIEYVEGNDKSAVQTLDEGFGDCHDVSALFVALCRTNKIPARMVWVHEHQYAEFCLQDTEGNLHWFPCESAGTKAFGEMPMPRVIMQKGDLFTVPERPRERLRYASDYLIGVPVAGSGKPRVRYIREQL